MPQRAAPPRLTVHLVLPSGFERFVAARLRLSLIDTALADAPARVLASQVFEQVVCEPGAVLRMDIPHTAASQTAASAGVQAHASRSGERGWARGDLATTQSWPVSPGATEALVRLSLI